MCTVQVKAWACLGFKAWRSWVGVGCLWFAGCSLVLLSLWKFGLFRFGKDNDDHGPLLKKTKEFQETSKKSMERMPPLLRLCRVDISKQLVSCIAEP